jgi:hypothetical protein
VRQHGKCSFDPKAAAKHITKMVEDVICLNWGAATPASRPNRAWTKPSIGWRKLNTDASFSSATSLCFGGVVIRDDSGKIVGASVRYYNHIPDVSGPKNPAHDHLTARVGPQFLGRARAKKIFAGFKISAHARPVRFVGRPTAGRAGLKMLMYNIFEK